MLSSLSPATAKTICLIVCHGGPADHFATYTETLSQAGYDVKIQALAGPAFDKLKSRGIQAESFSLKDLSEEQENELANRIAKTCAAASVVLTDAGHVFDVKLQQALEQEGVAHYSYYDNPEFYVPGGYSDIAAKVMLASQGVLTANSNLVEQAICVKPEEKVDFGERKRFGIGYYPVKQAETVAEKRKIESPAARAEFLKMHGFEDQGQKILAYIGGNNAEYLDKAFPAFLNILDKAMETQDLKNLIIAFQQHPGAKELNRDGLALTQWINDHEGNGNAPKVVLIKQDAQVAADAMLYYQTSMAPQFALAGIPTVHIGHERYEDILVRNQLCYIVNSSAEFTNMIGNLKQSTANESSRELILNALGFKENWPERILKIIQQIGK